MSMWVVWLLVALALGIVEVLTLTIDLALLAAAALVAGLVAALGFGIGFQFVAFAVSALALLLFVRPIARREMRKPPAMRSGAAALLGKQARVTADVSGLDGRVRIGGEEWTARAYDPSLVIRAGTTVDVLAIDGATAFVHPREEPWPN
jgi:membrane protein implicated in regulation of membrane protease activity